MEFDDNSFALQIGRLRHRLQLPATAGLSAIWSPAINIAVSHKMIHAHKKL